MSESAGICFVIMGFGVKTDFETGRVLNLDNSYFNLIKPAVEAAKLQCIRADEIVHSGLIDVPMYKLLLQADVVVCDLSTSNRNAIYELGVRHALRPYTTVVIAEEGLMKSPFFDLNHIVFRNYRHLGEDIGASEAKRFTAELTAAIKSILAKDPTLRQDSPVYQFINRLTPPAIAELMSAEIETPAPLADGQSHQILMLRADAAYKTNDFLKARMLLEEIREMRREKPAKLEGQPSEAAEDPYILQRLALATYKSKSPTELEALGQASKLLALLKPATSNDTETLGLWGAVHKRLWGLTKDETYLDEAVRAYERGFYMRNDYYNGINFAFLLNVRAAHSAGFVEAVADAVQAGRIRKEVISICENWLRDNPPPDPVSARAAEKEKYQESKYWVLATLAEAYFGRGDEAQYQHWQNEAAATNPHAWMLGSTQEQIAQLRALLEPLTSEMNQLNASRRAPASS